MITFDNGVQVLFSYETPVAARLGRHGNVKTKTKWSRTTSKHINLWLEGEEVREVEQDVLDSMPKILAIANGYDA